MKAGKSKNKGSQWERDLARFFTKWVTGNETPLIFWRTPGSGSFVTNNVSKDASGDLIAILPEGTFFTNVISCEAKNGYNDVDLFKHFKVTKNNTLEDFWDQCIRDAHKVNKYGLLIYKKKGYKPFVGMEERLLCQLMKLKIDLPRSISINFKDKLPTMVLFDMETLFTILLPEHIKRIKNT